MTRKSESKPVAIKRKQRAVEFCCEFMKLNVEQKCEQHAEPMDCPDNLIHWKIRGKRLRVGLIIHDGGHSFVQISYCPWCGQRISDFDAVRELRRTTPQT
jgi:hypothetical protein